MPGKRVGGLAHFGEADSRQVSSVGGPASTSVTDLVQLPGASLGIAAVPSDFSRCCMPMHRGVSPCSYLLPG